MKWLKGPLIFLLLMEWLRPLPSVAPINTPDIFTWLLIYLSLIAMIRLSSFIKFFLQTGGSIGAIYYLFHQQVGVDSWKEYIRHEWSYNYELVTTMNYLNTTAFSRTVGFILLLWIVTEVVFGAVLKKNQGIWFTLTTAAYLILLDIVTVYDVKWALVRVAVYSLMLLALLQIRQVERQWLQIPEARYQRSSWLFTSLAVILAITSVAYAVPKPQEAKTETFGFLPQSQYAQQKVGYQSANSTLGGPFMDDESIVFLAKTPEKHYWRGESRSIYTGSEWRDGGEPQHQVLPGTVFHFQPLIENMKVVEDVRTKIEFPEPRYNVLFYGGQLKKVIAAKPERAVLQVKRKHDITAAFSHDDKQRLSAYELLIDIPVINEEYLKASTMEYPRDVQANLQLPLNLPERIQELAYELTKDQKDPYSKVLAIQDYLKYNGGLVYEKKEVPYLERGQDFVDQFLFESKQGYCDHFSTSMIVLLRSIGIPARYVKGFSTGDMIKREDNLYEVTMKNKNAHSWPEVYFVGYGWIPFEPTPGFNQPVKHDAGQANESGAAQPVNTFIPPIDQEEVSMLNDADENPLLGRVLGNSLTLWFYLIVVVVFLIFVIILINIRNTIWIWFLYQRSTRIQNVEGLAQVYLSFMSLLGKIYTPRKDNESLQEFVSRISLQPDLKSELISVTHWYEKYFYGKSSLQPKEWENNRNILRRIIKYFLS